MAKIRPFGLVMEIIAVLAGVAMVLVAFLVFGPPTLDLYFLLLAIAGSVFILGGFIVFIIDIWKAGKKEKSVDNY
ncbi:MAG: hypothetical protein FK731_15170 [Asgard group archaeon]|nr:hypothetical protein [Asgard group archaeon]